MCVLLSCSPAFAATSVQLAWDPNTEPNLAGYRVYYGTGIGQFSHVLDVGNATIAEVEGLQAGTTYYFVVSAYNSANLESEYSVPIEFTTPPASGVTVEPGHYRGLIGDGSAAGSGSFSFQLSAKGSATGRLTIGGKVINWKGTITESGSLIVQLPISALAQGLSLELAISGEGEVNGSLTRLGSAAPVLGRKSTLNLPGVISPHAGPYTAVLQQVAGGDSSVPGFALGKVSNSGRFTVLATLPDGSRCACASPVDSTGAVPIFVKSRGRTGGLFGWLKFRDQPNVSDLDGSLSWLKFFVGAVEVQVTGARYRAPIGAAGRADLLALINGSRVTLNHPASLIAGTLAPVSGNSLVATGGGGEVISFRFEPVTGMFSGISVSPVGRSIPFNGVLLRKGTFRGVGRFKDANATGRVDLEQTGGS